MPTVQAAVTAAQTYKLPMMAFLAGLLTLIQLQVQHPVVVAALVHTIQ
jgi:hypothetical protein